MRRYGIVSYNMYCNFTNYGSALQTFALHNAINRIPEVESIVMDYCPDTLKDKDVLNPYKNLWDKDEESRKMVELTMPAIRENNDKFKRFYKEQYMLSSSKYTSANFNESWEKEKLNGYVCGADTIFCPDEFGLDDGYYANYDVMRQHSVSYAASFGVPHFSDEQLKRLPALLNNFKALGIREDDMLPYVKNNVSVSVKRVLDPTLLLTAEDYGKIIAPKQSNEKYILLYVRRYNAKMEAFAEKMAKEKSLRIIEISLRATNSDKHEMRYDAGVEEFLSLTKYAEYVVTNSFHSMIFAVHFKRPFYIFSREQCDTKINELLNFFGTKDRGLVTGEEPLAEPIDYDAVYKRVEKARKESMDFLTKELTEIL